MQHKLREHSNIHTHTHIYKFASVRTLCDDVLWSAVFFLSSVLLLHITRVDLAAGHIMCRSSLVAKCDSFLRFRFNCLFIQSSVSASAETYKHTHTDTSPMCWRTHIHIRARSQTAFHIPGMYSVETTLWVGFSHIAAPKWGSVLCERALARERDIEIERERELCAPTSFTRACNGVTRA